VAWRGFLVVVFAIRGAFSAKDESDKPSRTKAGCEYDALEVDTLHHVTMPEISIRAMKKLMCSPLAANRMAFPENKEAPVMEDGRDGGI
jgi:hypothetical protein